MVWNDALCACRKETSPRPPLKLLEFSKSHSHLTYFGTGLIREVPAEPSSAELHIRGAIPEARDSSEYCGLSPDQHI
jgi:hypothetical protein